MLFSAASMVKPERIAKSTAYDFGERHISANSHRYAIAILIRQQIR
jgi:hypothetical protein